MLTTVCNEAYRRAPGEHVARESITTVQPRLREQGTRECRKVASGGGAWADHYASENATVAYVTESLKVDLSNAEAQLQARVMEDRVDEVSLHSETFGVVRLGCKPPYGDVAVSCTCLQLRPAPSLSHSQAMMMILTSIPSSVDAFSGEGDRKARITCFAG